MNYTELITEVKARGFDYASDTRIGRWVNQAHQELCEAEPWSFREATATGASPLTVSDLGPIRSVINTDRDHQLRPEDVRTLLEWGYDLSDTGEPNYYYVTSGTVVNTHPVGGTLSVRHFKIPTDLTGTDAPIVPTRFHNLIVDGAVRRAYIDSDNFEAARAVEEERQAGVALMIQSLLWPNYQESAVVFDSSGSEDWG